MKRRIQETGDRRHETGDRRQNARRADGSGSDELLFESPEGKAPTSVSSDGKLLLFHHVVPETGVDIWALPLLAERKPFPVVVTPEDEGFAAISPAGRWVAYCAGDRQADQVYAEPFPPTGTRVRLSPTQGMSPQWTAGGRKVLYSTVAGEMMEVDLTFAGGAIQPGVARQMFTAPGLFLHNGFGLDRARSRVLTLPAAPGSGDAPISVILDWHAALRGAIAPSRPR